MGKWWKQRERQVARLFGSTRTPLSGGGSGHTRSDTLHPRLFIETKGRKRFAVVKLWDDTAKLARLESKTPVVALVEKGRPGFWLLVHHTDLRSVFSELPDE